MSSPLLGFSDQLTGGTLSTLDIRRFIFEGDVSLNG